MAHRIGVQGSIFWAVLAGLTACFPAMGVFWLGSDALWHRAAWLVPTLALAVVAVRSARFVLRWDDEKIIARGPLRTYTLARKDIAIFVVNTEEATNQRMGRFTVTTPGAQMRDGKVRWLTLPVDANAAADMLNAILRGDPDEEIARLQEKLS
jgi:hypothetical protein